MLDSNRVLPWVLLTYYFHYLVLIGSSVGGCFGDCVGGIGVGVDFSGPHADTLIPTTTHTINMAMKLSHFPRFFFFPNTRPNNANGATIIPAGSYAPGLYGLLCPAPRVSIRPFSRVV
jgi:hypothetical protein